MMRSKAGLLAIAMLTAAGAAPAQSDQERLEAERQASFRAFMETVVRELNEPWYGTFTDSIDRGDMLQRIYGLRLIDVEVKRGFEKTLEYTWDDLIASAFPEDKENGLTATLLGVESRGDRGRAVVRFDLPKFQFNYHEYDLRLGDKGQVIVVDWVDYLNGKPFSQEVGEYLVAGLATEPALRKLLDFNNPTQGELFQFRELLKSARDNQLPRYMEILQGLPERYHRQRIIVETTVQLAKRVRKRREMLQGLETMAKYYPNEPLYGLMLLDHYFPQKKLVEATRALQSVYRKIGFPDAAMEARLSAALLVQGEGEEALGYAQRALELEPGLELAWWSALNARAAVEDHAGAIEALTVLEDEFAYNLDAETLGKNPAYKALLAAPEFQTWRAGR